MPYYGMMIDGGGEGLTAAEYEAQVAADLAAQQAAEDAYYTVKVGDTGKTQAQLDAYQNAVETMNLVNETQPGSVTMNTQTGILTYPPPTQCPDGYTKDALGNCVQIKQPVVFIPTTGGNTTVNPTPNNPPPSNPPPPPPAIKTATPQYVTFNDDEVPVDVIVDLLFENVGGQELLSISRHDSLSAFQEFKYY